MKTTIGNFFKYSEMLYAGAQPNVEQIKDLKNQGIEAIINISPESARNFLKEEALTTEQLQMIYIHFPVDCSNLQKHHYPVFRDALKNLEDKKVFVHCGGNIKTSNLIHMYQVLEKGMNETDSLMQLKQIQNTEPKWFEYFKSFGMKGLR